MVRKLSILQANLNKQPGAQAALHNDEDTKGITAILGQEPSCFRVDSTVVVPGGGTKWTTFIPTATTESVHPVRSCLWLDREIKAEQIAIPTADVTAVVMYIRGRRIFLASVYIQARGSHRGQINARALEESDLQRTLTLLQVAIEDKQAKYPHLELLIAGDFNRHDYAWSGNHMVNSPEQGEAQPLRDWAERFDLQQLLPRGTITWERDGIAATTIDLVFASERLNDEKHQCKLWDAEYGSDHRVVHTAFELEYEVAKVEGRIMLKHTDWDKFRAMVSEEIAAHRPQSTDVDIIAEWIGDLVSRGVAEFTPKARPSQYAKRWWTTELGELRKEYTRLRNQARSRRRRGQRDIGAENTAKQARLRFHHKIRETKQQHWREFVEDVENVWKAAKYLDPERVSGVTRITALKTVNGETVEEDDRIAGELMREFFPPAPTPTAPSRPSDEVNEPQLEHEPLTVREVKHAIFRAKPDKAPGPDGLPARVWKELWPAMGDVIVSLFNASIDAGRLPTAWKTAKIIPLKKPGKGDYTVPKNFRPISLLCTLGKALEAVVAERISYLSEKHALLPRMHFGARKRRSAVQALVYLQEAAYDAWRENKTMSLVSFDVKGAFNNVAKGPELERLRKRRIPEALVRWIDDFCTDRVAYIIVNGVTSARVRLPGSGIPQGSPLSPGIFLFFNADLVQMRIRNGGSIAFVDDYSAWVIGPSARRNTTRIQEEILPELAKWEKESGAVFEASKTSFIHLTKYTGGNRLDNTPLHFKGESIATKETVKILGVTLDSKLTYRHHITKAAEKAYKAALALKRISGLHPAAARQLFMATVAPVADYASAVWYPVVSNEQLKGLERPQRVAAQSIIGCFRTVALAVAEAEASLTPVRDRLHRHSLRFWIDIQTLAADHPLALHRERYECTRYMSPIQKTARMFEGLRVDATEVARPFTRAPWAPEASIVVEDADQATVTATSTPANTVDIFVDRIISKGKAGIGIWSSTGTRHCGKVHPVCWASGKTVDLMAICAAVRLVNSLTTNDAQRVRVFSRSKSAVQAVANGKMNDGQTLCTEIANAMVTKAIELHWLPRDTNTEGEAEAHRLSRIALEDATRVGTHVLRHRSVESIRREAGKAHSKPKVDAFHTSPHGAFTKQLDKALPGKHTKRLYDRLTKSKAKFLSRLRTGCSPLNAFLHKIRASDTSTCECGSVETVSHFLFDCPRWEEHRADLRAINTERWQDLSYFLGGWTDKKQDGKFIDGDKRRFIPDFTAVDAVIEFTIKTRRFDQSGA
jgi:hypothetical protein